MNATTSLPLLDWAAQRDAALARVEANAGPCFMARALKFVPDYLRSHGEMSGEEITDACKRAGIVPENTDKAFGPVYQALLRDGIIERCGFCIRKRGHGTGGGSVYKLRTN